MRELNIVQISEQIPEPTIHVLERIIDGENDMRIEIMPAYHKVNETTYFIGLRLNIQTDNIRLMKSASLWGQLEFNIVGINNPLQNIKSSESFGIIHELFFRVYNRLCELFNIFLLPNQFDPILPKPKEGLEPMIKGIIDRFSSIG